MKKKEVKKKTATKTKAKNPNDDNKSFSSEESENEEFKAIQQYKKNKKVQDPSIEFLQSPAFNTNLNAILKERGVDFDLEDDSTNASTQQLSKSKKDYSKCSVQELEQIYRGYIKANNINKVYEVLQKLVQKDLPVEKMSYYGIKIAQITFQLNMQQESLAFCQKFLQNVSNDFDRMHLFLISSQCKQKLGKLWDSIIDYMRCNAIATHLNSNSEKKFEFFTTFQKLEIQDSWNETYFDQVKKQIQDQNLILESAFSNIKNKMNTLAVYNLKNTPTIYKELQNRTIYQLSSGDNHSLLLIGSCSCDFDNLQFYQKNCQGQFKCNGGTEVVAFGSNLMGQINPEIEAKDVEKPELIKIFTGKNIQGVCAHKSSSLCYDDQGNIYEWGFSKTYDENCKEILIAYESYQKIKDLQKGNEIIVILTQDGKIFIVNSIEINGETKFSTNDFKYLYCQSDIMKIAVGNNHVIALSKDSKVFVFGSNEYSQLGLDNEPFVKEFKEVPEISNFKFQKIYCFENSSFGITQQGELYYWGKVDDEIIKKPKYGQIENDQAVVSISSKKSKIYITTSNGDICMWEPKTNYKFSKIAAIKNQFRFISAQHVNIIATKTLPQPPLCEIIPYDKEKLVSMSELLIQIQLKDFYGEYGFKPFFNLNFQIYLAKEPIEKLQLLSLSRQQIDKSIEENKKEENKNQDISKISNISNRYKVEDKQILPTIVDLSEKRLATCVKIEQNQEVQSLYDLKFHLQKNGKYYLYVLINNQIIKNMPEILTIGKSEQQKQIEDEKSAVKEQKKQEKEEKQKEKLEKLKLLDEQKKQEELQKKLQTEERAKIQYAQYLEEQKQKKDLEEKARQEKLDMRTGGGYNLDKYSKMQEEGQEVEESKTTKDVEQIKIQQQKSVKVNNYISKEELKKNAKEDPKKKTILDPTKKQAPSKQPLKKQPSSENQQKGLKKQTTVSSTVPQKKPSQVQKRDSLKTSKQVPVPSQKKTTKK